METQNNNNEAGRVDKLKDAPAKAEVHRKTRDSLAALKASTALETLKVKSYFTKRADGKYEVGSLTQHTKIPQYGRDLYRETGAQKLTYTDTRFGEDLGVERSAHWSKKDNAYLDETNKTVHFYNDHYYLINAGDISTGENAQPEMVAAAVPSTLQEVRREEAADTAATAPEAIGNIEFASRAQTFMKNFQVFMNNVFPSQSSVTIDSSKVHDGAPRGEASGRVEGDNTMYYYSPDDAGNDFRTSNPKMKLGSGTVFEQIVADSERFIVKAKVPHLGTFRIETTVRSMSIKDGKNVIANYNYATNAVTGDSARFVAVSDAINADMVRGTRLAQKHEREEEKWNQRDDSIRVI